MLPNNSSIPSFASRPPLQQFELAGMYSSNENSVLSMLNCPLSVSGNNTPVRTTAIERLEQVYNDGDNNHKLNGLT
jgi:hypothetical protein